jgi:ABC-type antimicrobial peptide transport system permease subunit
MMLEGGRAALCGAAVGIVAALGLTRLVTAFLFGVRPWDPVSFLAAPLILGLVALAAVWIPARRVARVDPASALRCE